MKRHTSKSQYWIRPGAFGSRSIFGVLADENSNTVWACSNDLSAIGVLVAGCDSKSTLKGFDLKTGAGKVSAVLPNEHSLCNDIAVGQDGSVFVTNSAAPEILRLPPGSQRLEVWITDSLLQAPAGAAALTPERTGDFAGAQGHFRFLKNLSSKRTYDDVQPFLSD